MGLHRLADAIRSLSSEPDPTYAGRVVAYLDAVDALLEEIRPGAQQEEWSRPLTERLAKLYEAIDDLASVERVEIIVDYLRQLPRISDDTLTRVADAIAVGRHEAWAAWYDRWVLGIENPLDRPRRVRTDSDVLDGIPHLGRGPHVALTTIAALTETRSNASILEDYPFLDSDDVECARQWAALVYDGFLASMESP